MGRPPARGRVRIQRFARPLVLLMGLGWTLACVRTPAPDEVWLDQAPHLLEVDWRLPRPGERGVVATTPRAVLEFFVPRSEPLEIRLHGWAVRPDPVPVHVTVNGGCEVGSWNVMPGSSDGVLSVGASCVRPGVNLLEFETLGSSPGGFSLESLSVAPAGKRRSWGEEPTALKLEAARVGLQLRTAVIASSPSFDVPLRIDEPAILETALGLPGRGWTRSMVQVHVRLRVRGADGKERIVADRTLGAGGEGAGSWEPVRADLSAYAGQTVTLRVERETMPTKAMKAPAFPYFADPARLVTVESPRLIPVHPDPGGPPPVVLVVFDTLRPDHLPMYGHSRKTAPHLEALAREGVTFGTCLSAAPWTLPSVASILTGLYPWQHQAGLRLPLKGGVSPEDEADFLAPFRTFRMVSRMTPHARTLAERMSAEGYLSAGFVENSYLSDRSGLARGFSRYVWANDLRKEVEDPAARRRFFASDLPVREWLQGHEFSRVFLFRHYIAPHLPYMAIPGEERFVRPQDAPEIGDYFEDEEGLVKGRYGAAARKRIVDLYDESIFLADRRFGDLIAALEDAGLYDRALIIVTSDHGEEFWDHGGYGHGHSLYREVLQVPLIVKLPGGRLAGSRVASPVRLIDLAPTILDLAGSRGGSEKDFAKVDAAAITALPGRPLRLEDTSASPDFAAFAGAMLYGPPRKMAWHDRLALIVTETHGEKLIFEDRPSPPARPFELYDMASDPAQKRDLSVSRPELVVRMKTLLDESWKTLVLEAPPAGGLELSDEAIEQLESLGYAAHKRDGGKSAPAPGDAKGPGAAPQGPSKGTEPRKPDTSSPGASKKPGAASQGASKGTASHGSATPWGGASKGPGAPPGGESQGTTPQGPAR